MSSLSLSEMERAAREASAGPWRLVRHTCGLDGKFSATDDWSIMGASGNVVCIEGNRRDGPLVGDPDFIAAMNPQTALALIEVARRAKELMEASSSPGTVVGFGRLRKALENIEL